MIIRNTKHEAQFDWGEISVQGGEQGVVATKNGSYRTAFVEAFPKNPQTFIRGEGTTVQEAEQSAWNQYQKILDCENHEFERRGYRNGLGFCKHCDLAKSNVFEPLETCQVCGCPTFFASDKDGKYYCRDHKSEIPKDKRWNFFSFNDDIEDEDTDEED